MLNLARTLVIRVLAYRLLYSVVLNHDIQLAVRSGLGQRGARDGIGSEGAGEAMLGRRWTQRDGGGKEKIEEDAMGIDI